MNSILLAAALVGTHISGSTVDMQTDLNLVMQGPNVPTVSGNIYTATLNSYFDWDFTDSQVMPSTNNLPTTFPPSFILTRDIMQQSGALAFSSADNRFQLRIVAPQSDLSTLTIASFGDLLSSDQLSLNYRWWDPTYDSNFVNWWEGTALKDDITLMTSPIPEPSSIPLIAVGLAMILDLNRRRNAKAA